METLKELKDKCSLIAEFKNPLFIEGATDNFYSYGHANKCALYTDNKGKFYLYKYIQIPTIQEYDKYDVAIDRFTSFVGAMLRK